MYFLVSGLAIMEMRENKKAVNDENESLVPAIPVMVSMKYQPKGFRKLLSTKNLIVAACLTVILGLSNIIWMSVRYYKFCHHEEKLNGTECTLGKPLPYSDAQ